ncbi:MAG: glycosyltransferase [Candidatus Omnitrophica bacterium]|nr:glycosyltransferase [Candidatus Omnitrophota bacterium]
MAKPHVSIIIPTYNSASTLGQTIEACLAQDYPKDKLDIIVVDDGSTDNTKDIISQYSVTYICQENKGPAAARNIGWRKAKGDVVFFTDADCMPARDCLALITDVIFKKDIAVVAGTYGIKNEKSIVAKSIHEEIIFRHRRMPSYINSFGTYNVLIKKGILEELDGFNENYLSSSAEDSELSYRIIAKGYKIYFEKRAKVLHFHEESLCRYLKQQFRRAFWITELLKNHSVSVLKDYYAHWKDFIEVPLAVLIIISAFFLRDSILIVLASTYLLIQAFVPFSIYLKKRDIRVFLILLTMMCMRGFVRMIGGVSGILRRVRL